MSTVAMPARLFALALAVCCLAGAAQATVITASPGSPSNGNTWPLTTTGSLRWQQGYDSTLFSAVPTGQALRIDSIGFLADDDRGPISFTDLEVRLTTSPNAVGSLSSTYADNLGSDVVLARDGLLTVSGVDGDYTVISLTTAFDYDPSQGDLLIDIQHGGGTGQSLSFLAYGLSQGAEGLLQRVAETGVSDPIGVNRGVGGALVTQFNGSLVSAGAPTLPGPAPLALLLAGVAALGLGRRLQRGDKK